MRNAARELDDLETARDLAESIGQHLAVLGGEDARDVLAMLVEQLAHAKQDLRAPRQRGRAPGRERLLGRPDSFRDLPHRPQANPPGLPPPSPAFHTAPPALLPSHP